MPTMIVPPPAPAGNPPIAPGLTIRLTKNCRTQITQQTLRRGQIGRVVDLFGSNLLVQFSGLPTLVRVPFRLVYIDYKAGEK